MKYNRKIFLSFQENNSLLPNEATDDEKGEFYKQHKTTVDQVQENDVAIVLGDLHAKSSQQRYERETSTG